MLAFELAIHLQDFALLYFMHFQIGTEISKTSPRIEFAHILRGIAASAVVISHLTYLIWREPNAIGALISYPAVPKIIRSAQFSPITDFGLPYFWGHFGVALFFLISGFVIPFSVSSLSRSGFMAARIFRIWPTYLVGLVIAVTCIALNSARSNIAFPYSAVEVLTSALILPRWPTLTRSIDGIIWTLEIEIFFYGLCVVMMDLIRSFDWRIFLLTLLVVPLAYVVGSQGETLMGMGMPVYALAHWASAVPVYVSFMLCGTALYYHYRGHLARIELLMIHAFLLVAFVTSMRVGVLAEQGWTAPTCYLFAYAVFILSYLGRDWLATLPSWGRQPIYWLADISYPLYAVHGVLGYTILVHTIEAGISSWGAVAIALATVLAVAALVHRMIELPSQFFGKSLAFKLGPAQDLNSQSKATPISSPNVEMKSVTSPNSISGPLYR
jgi:peptidoglycan/LPS O-acetylase OafA/YrhL